MALGSLPALLAIVLSTACSEAAGSEESALEGCPAPVRQLYDAHYEASSGDCPLSTVAGAPHVYIERDNTLVAQVEMLSTGDVRSYFMRDGCAVHVSQWLTDPAHDPVASIELDVIARLDGTLSGTADVVGFDATGEPTCEGSFDVELTPVASDAP